MDDVVNEAPDLGPDISQDVGLGAAERGFLFVVQELDCAERLTLALDGRGDQRSRLVAHRF